jgi:hypothetical protein
LAIAIPAPGGAKLGWLIGTGPFHFPTPSTHETRRAPSLPTDNAVRVLSVCLAIAILLLGRAAVAEASLVKLPANMALLNIIVKIIEAMKNLPTIKFLDNKHTIVWHYLKLVETESERI